MTSSEGKCIRFSRSGAVDWELKRKYFSVKSSRFKAFKEWEHSRYYPPKDVQDRINRLLMRDYVPRVNGRGDFKEEEKYSEIASGSGSSFDQNTLKEEDFTKGLIIRLRINSPGDQVLDEAVLRKNIRTIGDSNEITIAYIDLKDTTENVFNEDGSIERSCFIRLNCPEDALKLLDKIVIDAVTNKHILEGEEEIKYWNRMKECQENQKSKKRRKR